MSEHYVASGMSVDGHNGRDGAEIEIFDYLGGKKEVYAIGKLATSSDRQSLDLTITKQAANEFPPEHVVLHRVDDAAVSDLGTPNWNLIAKALQQVPKH